MSIYLCGNTGIVNRGCEAIIRSTNKLLSNKFNSLYLATQTPQQDILMCKEEGINLLQYDNLNTVQRFVGKGMRLLGNYTYSEQIRQQSIISKLKPKDICLNIGGDTYCYDKPLGCMALNKLAKSKKARTILWCCSIEESVIASDVKKDLKRYDYIFARDSITVENLIKKGIKSERIIKVCDPAFFLLERKVELPTIFKKGNVLGLNISECVVNGEDKTVYSAVLNFARNILKTTDLNICLIPHVYSIEKNICDWPILNSLKNDLCSERVGIVDKELNCEELKYIISNCRFLVAARTHASIAAYSTCVPTLVLGYSVKSKGIAKDLFGTYENYVVPYDEIKTDEDIIKPFNYIVSNEDKIRRRLTDFLPEYKNSLADAIEKYINQGIDYSKICDRYLCSGCMACKTVCPQNAISMKADYKGFDYPEIDLQKCIKCNKCRDVCPALNKVKDSLAKPKCFGFINADEKERKDSSSGGAFIRIATPIIENGGVVYGVGFNEFFDAEFARAESMIELTSLQKSKYVQAKVGDVYNKVKVDLDEGKQVLFSGCPCHVVALKRLLGKKYENLITIDIICHGVPSPMAWREYIRYLAMKHNSTISRVSFREKNKGWSDSSALSISFSNGEKEVDLLSKNRYFQGFMAHYYLRESCYNCSVRNMHRQSDITLADFWGIDKLDSSMFDNKGTSLLLVHTNKGIEIVESLRDAGKCKKYLFEEAIKLNPAYLVSGQSNMFIHQFDAEWRKKGLIQTLEKYLDLPKHKVKYALKSLKTWSNRNE